MLECIIPEAKHCNAYISMDPRFFFLIISWEIVSLLMLKDKQNVKFGGVVRCELYMYYECISHVFA